MAFKLFKDKSSVLKRHTRYVQGGATDVKQKKLGWWERRVDFLKYAADDIVIESLPLVYAYRPTLLAYDFYQREDLAWLILQYNNIVDIEEEFAPGASIRLPSADRVKFEILTKSVNHTNVNA